MFNPESLHNPYITCSEPAHKRTQHLHGKTIILRVEAGANITEGGKCHTISGDLQSLGRYQRETISMETTGLKYT